MKTFSLWLAVLMSIVPAAFLDAKDMKYKAKMVGLFEQSASCQIKGTYSWADVNCEVNHTAKSDNPLGEIKKCFLNVNANYFGLDNVERPPSMHSCHLSITWKDINDKIIAEMSLLDGKVLIFSDKAIYKVDDITLLVSLVLVTNPEAFAHRKK